METKQSFEGDYDEDEDDSFFDVGEESVANETEFNQSSNLYN